MFPKLPYERFEVIYADPPWQYRNLQYNATRRTSGSIKHYSTVALADLKKLEVSKISARDSLLYLWASGPILDEAIELGKAWGFSWATVAFVWDKMRPVVGHYTMSQCELCLLFKRGKIPCPRGVLNVRQLVREKRRIHSQKPDEVRLRIDAMFPSAKKIELFARANTNGWVSWGNEI